MNMKKLVAGVLACCIVGGVMPNIAGVTDNAVITASAEEGTYEQLTYNSNRFGFGNSDIEIAITGCDKSATEVVIPDEIDGYKVKYIRSGAFEDCTALTSVTISDGIESIGTGVFANCTSLTELTIPESVEDISYGAFESSNLKDITILNPLCRIGDDFIGDYSTDSNYTIHGYDNSTAQVFAKRIDANFESIGKSPISVATSGTCGENVTYILDDEGTLIISGTGDMDSLPTYASGYNWDFNLASVKKIIVENGIKNIGAQAFRGMGNLTSVTIPDSVITIEDTAFCYCYALTSVEIPDSVVVIGNSAFYGCKNLTDVIIPETLTDINGWAFYETPWLEAKQAENQLVVVNNVLIDGKTCSGDIVIPDSVKEISASAFYGSNLTSVTIPDSVESINTGTFQECDSLTDVIIPETLTDISGWAFFGTPWLEAKQAENPLVVVNDVLIDGKTCSGDIVIPDGVKEISASAFYGSDLTSVTIPDSVTSIGNSAFSYCYSLTDIIIPETLIDINGWAFNETPWLEAKQAENPLVVVNDVLIDGKTCSGDIVIPNDVKYISASAFYKCRDLTSVTIPDSVTNIYNWAFEHCENLTTVIIPDSTTDIGKGAFKNCYSLTEVTILNSECDIYDWKYTLCESGTATIYGYENSTAQAYAEKYSYKFESLGTAPEEELSTGDINGDNKIDASDSSLILAEYSLLSTSDSGTFTESMKKSADINKDGKIDSTDASLILSYYSYTSTGGTDTLEKFIESAENK